MIRIIGIFVVIAFIVCIGGLLSACGASVPNAHQDIELQCYSEEKSLCVKEATDFDGGQHCLDKVTAEYAQFWNVDVTVTDAGPDGAK